MACVSYAKKMNLDMTDSKFPTNVYNDGLACMNRYRNLGSCAAACRDLTTQLDVCAKCLANPKLCDNPLNSAAPGSDAQPCCPAFAEAVQCNRCLNDSSLCSTSSKLSTGALVGIIVGSLVGFVIIVIAIVLIVKNRREKLAKTDFIDTTQAKRTVDTRRLQAIASLNIDPSILEKAERQLAGR